LGDEQRERLGVAGDPQRSGIPRIEARVADQRGGHMFAALFVAAIHQAGSGGIVPGLEHAE
jgi:hypothetical protein